MPDLDRVVPLRTGGTLEPLFCVHAVSGSAYSYAGLTRLLGPDQPVYGFEAPGFDNDRAPVASLPVLADEYTETLRAFQPSDGYRLLGWSLGGLLVFEMAKRLVADGAKVSSLILVDAGMPSVLPLPPEREVLLRYLRDMMGSSDETPHVLSELADRWPSEVTPKVAFEAVEQAGVFPEEMDAELLAQQYEVFRAHLSAYYSIELGGRYDGPAVHILASASPAEEMRWQRLCPNLTEYTVAGTHHSMWTGDSLTTLAGLVRQSLTTGWRRAAP
ncbi:MAG: alpha/beta fold hydrolase [Actinomycetota bacterium]|nr:alpha/beta fold hydrolase [Actinomycetota bacterium]